MPRKLVLVLAITSLSACSHTYNPEQISFISKPLSTHVAFRSCDHVNEKNCTRSNQNELESSATLAESVQLPKRASFQTETQKATNKPEKIISPKTTVEIAKQKTIISPKIRANLIQSNGGTIQTREIKAVAEFPTTVLHRTKQPDIADANSPTFSNIPHLNTRSGNSKICLGTPAKSRLALHPNWDSLKKLEINKAIFKQLFIEEPSADSIAAINDILFNEGEVTTRDNSEQQEIDTRNYDPNQTKKTRSRAAKLHENHKNYRSLIQEIAEQTQVDPALLHAIIQAESSYNPYARSPRGAVGLMQLMPATGRRFGAKNLTDPIANVYAGARYLRHLLELFNYNKKLALAGYNAGEYAVKRHGNKIPPYRQTQQYVNKVMSLYEVHRDNM
jgi:hypothetical protein